MRSGAGQPQTSAAVEDGAAVLTDTDFAPAVAPRHRPVDGEAYDGVSPGGDVHGCRRSLEPPLATLAATADGEVDALAARAKACGEPP